MGRAQLRGVGMTNRTMTAIDLQRLIARLRSIPEDDTKPIESSLDTCLAAVKPILLWMDHTGNTHQFVDFLKVILLAQGSIEALSLKGLTGEDAYDKVMDIGHMIYAEKLMPINDELYKSGEDK